mmetsp:Transcript_33870/g.95171  ORF Transcript_33870/g.95171 Transcript_33870/m.95171 type:complete len:299 (+) Transcript_33870:295-1191(+)
MRMLPRALTFSGGSGGSNWMFPAFNTPTLTVLSTARATTSRPSRQRTRTGAWSACGPAARGVPSAGGPECPEYWMLVTALFRWQATPAGTSPQMAAKPRGSSTKYPPSPKSSPRNSSCTLWCTDVAAGASPYSKSWRKYSTAMSTGVSLAQPALASAVATSASASGKRSDSSSPSTILSAASKASKVRTASGEQSWRPRRTATCGEVPSSNSRRPASCIFVARSQIGFWPLRPCTQFAPSSTRRPAKSALRRRPPTRSAASRMTHVQFEAVSLWAAVTPARPAPMMQTSASIPPTKRA